MCYMWENSTPKRVSSHLFLFSYNYHNVFLSPLCKSDCASPPLCFPPFSLISHHLDHTHMSLILSLLAPPFAVVVPCVLEPLCVWPVLWVWFHWCPARRYWLVCLLCLYTWLYKAHTTRLKLDWISLKFAIVGHDCFCSLILGTD